MGANSRQWSATMRERLRAAICAAERDRGRDRRRRRRRAIAREGAPTIEGAVDAVRRIAGELPVGVASSSHRAVIDAALARDRADATSFGAVVSSDEVAARQARAGRLSSRRPAGSASSPTRCLVVEDSINGVQARRAPPGMTTVLVPNRAVPPAAGRRARSPTVVLERLADLDLDARRARPSARRGSADRGRATPPSRSDRDPSRPPVRSESGWPDRDLGRRPGCSSGSGSRAPSACRRGPAIYCFNHLNWIDPFVLHGASLPVRPRLTSSGRRRRT